MAIVQILSGEAVLIVGDERIEGVAYRIEVHEIGYRRQMRGVLVGADSQSAAFVRAFGEGSARLEIQEAIVLSITPTTMSALKRPPTFGFVAIPVSGAV